MCACNQANNLEPIEMHWHDHAAIPILQPQASRRAQGRKGMHQHVQKGIYMTYQHRNCGVCALANCRSPNSGQKKCWRLWC